MTRDDIVQMLKDYRMVQANIQRLKVEIAALERSGTLMQWSRADALSQLQSPQINGMPRGNTASNPTERIALSKEAPSAIASEKMDAKNMDAKQAELFALQGQERATKIMLACLYDKERFIVEQHLVAGLIWAEVAKRHMEIFGSYLHSRTGREIQAKALEKMEGLFSA